MRLRVPWSDEGASLAVEVSEGCVRAEAEAEAGAEPGDSFLGTSSGQYHPGMA